MLALVCYKMFLNEYLLHKKLHNKSKHSTFAPCFS